MDKKYAEWIEKNVTDIRGTCRDVTLQMAGDFPELTRVRGHYFCPVWGERAHWWLVTSGGEVVDPTKEQFPSKGIGHYEPWDESQPEPTGMCPECGEHCYDFNTFCSDACGRAYCAYLGVSYGAQE